MIATGRNSCKFLVALTLVTLGSTVAVAASYRAEARRALANYFRFYNERRSHQALDYRTPDEVYFGALVISAAA